MKHILFPLLLATSSPVFAATVTLESSDSLNESSFNTALNWSNNEAPSALNDYVVLTESGQNALRTPVGSGDLTFMGNSLLLGDTSGSGRAQLSMKSATGSTITINGLSMSRGFVRNNEDGTDQTLAGSIELLAGGGSLRAGQTVANKSLTVTSTISGIGELSLLTYVTGSDLVLASAGANTFSGGTIVETGEGIVDVRTDFALGTGAVTIASDATLLLNLGLTNNYISDSASLVFTDGTGTVNLDFSGADVVGGISFDNGSTFEAAGTYGAVGSGAMFENAVFSGSGLLTVVPEPSSAMLIVGGFLVGIARRSRKA